MTAIQQGAVRIISGGGAAGRACSGATRRDLLTFGGLSALGLMASAAGPAVAAAPSRAARFGQAKHVLLIYLFGGASQFETWDPKPEDTLYLGFKVNSAEYKVMGLAPYGEPAYVDRIKQLIHIAPDGTFRLDMRYFAFDRG
ncbi:MAG: carbamoyltransferase N-terminal domain-containing protein, partial [Actinomycetota bacterium]